MTPRPSEVRAARKAAGLSQAAAAKLVFLSSRVRWTEYENGRRAPDPARWELFLLLTDQHPSYRCLPRE